jgi:serine protease
VLAIRGSRGHSIPARTVNRIFSMKRLLGIPALVAALALLIPALPASAGIGVAPAREFVPEELIVKLEGQAERTLSLPRGARVGEAARALAGNPRVEYAAPNYIATASAVAMPLTLPNDSGTLPGLAEAASAPGDWTLKQWNLLPWRASSDGRLPHSPGGIDAVGAWANLEAVGRAGGKGVVVAVLDTGVAYRNQGTRFRRSPDFSPGQFVAGYDFVDDDRVPLDENGHGTHVAGTIAEKTGNGSALTGIAHGAKLMPIRVLDAQGRGEASKIAKGIRFAIANRAHVINLSFNFGCGKQVPGVNEALREAAVQGIVVVASVGNLGAETCVSAPATSPRAIGVGGSTEGGCLGSYSLAGRAVDLLAPGGGTPAPGCPSISARPIYQVTLKPGTTREFAMPSNYVGTSMAAAHVSGAAALVIASGVVRRKAQGKGRIDLIRRKLTGTARTLNLPLVQQGSGLIDVAAATRR